MTEPPASPPVPKAPRPARLKDRECPCGAGKSYEECCAPLHRGEQEAADPVTLMRSRYAAFAMGQVEYLWRTLHPQYPDRVRPREELLRDLRRSVRRLRYHGLTILDSRTGSDEAQVLFRARVFDHGKDCSFIELSTFLTEPEGWRYFDGTGAPAAGISAEGLTLAAFQDLMKQRTAGAK